MRSSLAALVACAILLGAAQYRLALPGYHYVFPRDHFNHPDFETEWWYYTGNLHTVAGRRFGFELTFFRRAISRAPSTNVWDVRDVWFAHLALSDIDGNRFLSAERLNRAGAGLAGADLAQERVWNGNWQARWQPGPTVPNQQIEATAAGFSIALSLHPAKPPVIQGINGVSQKAAGRGKASHYISLTHLVTQGTLTVRDERFTVEGLSWMDHEFFTHQLEPNQTGWDWFSLQFDDGSELMLFRLRRKDGTADPYSAGTYIDPQGRTLHLTSREFVLTPGRTWTSSVTRARYPIEWTIRAPTLALDVTLTTRLPQQELVSRIAATPAYWEGAIEARGQKQAHPVRSGGYLEMTGYAAPAHMEAQ